jgi:hypothetical protein
MFILLARDPDAPKIVRLWCVFREMLIEAGIKPSSDMAAIAEAKQCAYSMERWYREHEITGRLTNDTPARDDG